MNECPTLEPTAKPKEMTMNAFATALYRDVTCGAAAALITVVLAMSFLVSTQNVPGSQPASYSLTLQMDGGWFGQPQPAVLVD